MKDSSADTTHTIPGGERTLSQAIIVTHLNLDTIIRDEVLVETEEDVTDAEEEDHDEHEDRVMRYDGVRWDMMGDDGPCWDTMGDDGI